MQPIDPWTIAFLATYCVAYYVEVLKIKTTLYLETTLYHVCR